VTGGYQNCWQAPRQVLVGNYWRTRIVTICQY
jgi:hypothetical protein